jgi:hypothetical protein
MLHRVWRWADWPRSDVVCLQELKAPDAALRDAVMLSHEILMTQLAVVVAQVGEIRDDLDQYEEDKENPPHGRN